MILLLLIEAGALLMVCVGKYAERRRVAKMVAQFKKPIQPFDLKSWMIKEGMLTYPRRHLTNTKEN